MINISTTLQDIPNTKMSIALSTVISVEIGATLVFSIGIVEILEGPNEYNCGGR